MKRERKGQERKERITEIWENRWDGHLRLLALTWRKQVYLIDCERTNDLQDLFIFLKYNKKFDFEKRHNFNRYERAATTAPILTGEEFIGHICGIYQKEETRRELETLIKAGIV